MARRAGFHELLPSPRDWKAPTANLASDLRQAGISKIFLLRHGQTAKSESGADLDRQLTETGREQSRVAGATFGKNVLAPLYPKILVSPAPRTVETAQLFWQAALMDAHEGESCGSNINDETVGVELIMISDLYDKAMQPAGSKLFAKIGYAPLLDYLGTATTDETDRLVAHDVLGKYAAAAIDAIHNVIAGDPNDDDLPASSSTSSSTSTTLLVVAHAIYLPSAALAVAATLGCDVNESLNVPLSVNTREAEGYLIDLTSREVSYLSRP